MLQGVRVLAKVDSLPTLVRDLGITDGTEKLGDRLIQQLREVLP